MALEIFRLVGSVFVDTDEANKSLQKTDKNAEGFGQTLLNGIGTAAKWAAGIAAAAGTAAAALSVASLKSYADYEQLVGGVETLFGESSDTILQYADGAYKTAGLTANAYMETITGFAASLLQSLDGDTAAAAEYANQAITDMSDNANKMGTSMETIQAAYQGFAKQNYSMLDNLKLGYGGTQAEMYRLMEDAQALGAEFNSAFYLTNKGTLVADFADITTAIHTIQTAMGITGTTALEAESTISGSIAMIKGKLENFKTTIGAALAPVVKEFLAFVIEQLPTIEVWVNQLADVWIPGLITAISDCATWIREAISVAVEWAGIIASELNAALIDCNAWLQENRDKVIEWTGYIAAATAGVVAFLAYLAWGNVMTAAAKALKTVTVSVQAFNAAMKKNTIGIIISLVSALITWLVYLYNTNDEFKAFVDGMLASIWAKLQDVIAWIQENVVPVIQEILAWFQANAMPILQSIMAWFMDTALPALLSFFSSVWEGLKNVIAWVDEHVLPVIQTIMNWINENIVPVISTIVSWLFETIGGFWSWLTSSFQSTGDDVGGIWETIKGFFQSALDFIVGIWEACQPFFQGIWEGIIEPVWGLLQEMWGAFVMAWEFIQAAWVYAEPFFSGIWEGIKAVFSVVAEVLGYCFSAAWEGIKAVWNMVGPFFTLIWENIKAVFSVVGAVLGGFFSTAWEMIKAVWNTVISFFTAIWAGIEAIFAVGKGILTGDFTDAWTAIQDLWDKVVAYFTAVWDGIKNVFGAVGEWFGGVFTAAWEAIQKVFANFGKFFSDLWETIKSTFSELGTKIGGAIGDAVKAGINGVIGLIEGTINGFIGLINGAINLINKIPGVNIGKLNELSFPRLEKGGVLEKGEVGLLEGNGAEAVVPLHQNQKWISAVARDMDAAIGRAPEDQNDIEQHLIVISSKLDALLDALLATQTITMNKREFARLVKEVG